MKIHARFSIHRAVLCALVLWPTSTWAESVPGYLRAVPPESAAAREARKRIVAARRAGPAVIVHRGASAFAPENTLEAYAAAMDLGADGCEVDLRRTADGVIVLFHDDMLDHLTDGFGTVRDLTYVQLLRLRPRFEYGLADGTTRPPTFAALLTLARERGMLLHLDVKEPDLEEDLERLIDSADAWEHVVSVNSETAPRLAKSPKVKALRYKVPGLYEKRSDLDPAATRAALEKPGELIMVDDPRVSSLVLKRTFMPTGPVAAAFREEWIDGGGAAGPAQEAAPSAEALLAILERDDSARAVPGATPEEESRRVGPILERARAAQGLGRIGKKSERVVKALEFQLRHRSLHHDWMWHGLDGAIAARALGEIGAVESVPVLIEAYLRVDPELEKVRDPRFAANPLSWTDFRTKMYIIPALGVLRCEAAKKFLLECLTLNEANARELAPPAHEEATRALMGQGLRREEIEGLLRHPNPAIRGTALLECLDGPATGPEAAERAAALRAAAPWAIPLPRRP